MKTIIEFFKWDYEGEYQQYFYVTENEKELVKEVLRYLNEEKLKEPYPWDMCLSSFKEEDRVIVDFGDNSYITHLNRFYYINYSEGEQSPFHLEQNDRTIVRQELTYDGKEV
jgi:hypothetical protein